MVQLSLVEWQRAHQMSNMGKADAVSCIQFLEVYRHAIRSLGRELSSSEQVPLELFRQCGKSL